MERTDAGRGSGGGCPAEETLQVLARGALAPGPAEAARVHLRGCSDCRSALARAEHTLRLPLALRGVGNTDATPVLAPAPSLDAQGALQRGSSLGRYLVLDKLGQGGMGEVYAAFDPQLNRKVALKLLLPREGAGLQTEAQARLLREAQAMARLSHPNVLPVYDVGELGGNIFVAMELVEGTTLRRWLARQQRPWQEVVRTFVEAGKGLGAAHRAGIVHRDFKPDNVLIGQDGRVHVMDFGLARSGQEELREPPSPALEPDAASLTPTPAPGPLLESPLTRVGTVIGTPGYMPPEQYRNEPLDGRADMFAFCASLYLGLYNQKAFAGETAEALSRATLAGEVQPPPAGSRVPAWVYRVLVRGLSPRREDRYPTMESLLTALQADPAARHRRTASALAAGALLVGAVGLQRHLAGRQEARCTADAQLLNDSWSPERQEAIEEAFLATGAPFAVDAWRGVHAALDGYTAAWVEQRTDACLATRVRGEASERVLTMRAACLESRRSELRSLTDVFARADADVVTSAVEAARALSPLEACADVDALLRRELRTATTPDEARRAAAAREALARAKALLDAGKHREGLEVAAPMVAEARALRHRPLEAEALALVGQLRVLLDDDAQGEQDLKQAVWAAEEARHEDVAVRALTALTEALGEDAARTREASDWAALGQALLTRDNVGGMLAAELYSARGVLLLSAGRYAEAETALRQALALAEGVAADQPDVAMLQLRLGNALSRQGKQEEGRLMLARALVTFERVLGPEHPRVGVTLQHLSSTLAEMDRNQEALEAGRRALAIFERSLPRAHLLTGYALQSVAGALARMGRYSEALTYYQQALEVRERARGPDHPDVAVPCFNMGDVLTRLGRRAEALSYYQRALSLQEQGLEKDHPHLAYTLTSLGDLHLQLGRPAEAVARLERALRIREAVQAPASLTHTTRLLLARALLASGRDRARARTLALQVRDELAGKGEEELREAAAKLLADAGP